MKENDFGKYTFLLCCIMENKKLSDKRQYIMSKRHCNTLYWKDGRMEGIIWIRKIKLLL